jgi:hypothetical protein
MACRASQILSRSERAKKPAPARLDVLVTLMYDFAPDTVIAVQCGSGYNEQPNKSSLQCIL